MLKRITIGAMLLFSASCTTQNSSVISEAEANAISDKVIATFASRDPAKLVALYTADRMMLDSEHNRPYADSKRFGEFAKGLMALKPTQKVLHRTIKILDADTFVNITLGSVSIETPEGPTTVTVRYTQVFQKQADGGWKIAVEHLSSAPEKE